MEYQMNSKPRRRSYRFPFPLTCILVAGGVWAALYTGLKSSEQPPKAKSPEAVEVEYAPPPVQEGESAISYPIELKEGEDPKRTINRRKRKLYKNLRNLGIPVSVPEKYSPPETEQGSDGSKQTRK